jgi:hypothetical protein
VTSSFTTALKLKIRILGFRVKDSGFRIEDLRLRFKGFVHRVKGFGLKSYMGLEFRVWGL